MDHRLGADVAGAPGKPRNAAKLPKGSACTVAAACAEADKGDCATRTANGPVGIVLALGSTATRPGRPSEARVGNPATDLSASDDADVVAVSGSDGTTDARSPEPPMPAGRKPLPAAKDTGVPALGAPPSLPSARDGRWVTVPAAAASRAGRAAAADVSPTSAEATPDVVANAAPKPAAATPTCSHRTTGKEARRAPVVSERRRLGTEPATNNPPGQGSGQSTVGGIYNIGPKVDSALPGNSPRCLRIARCPAGG